MTFISTSDERLKISTDAAKHLSVDVLALAKWEHLRLLQSRICGIDEKLSKLGFFSWGKKKKKRTCGCYIAQTRVSGNSDGLTMGLYYRIARIADGRTQEENTEVGLGISETAWQLSNSK